MPSSAAPVAGSSGRSNDWRRASTTWIASPAAIASLATSTAWMYSSRPRLVPTGPPSDGEPADAAAGRPPRDPFSRAVDPAISAALGRELRSKRLEDRLLGDPVAALEIGRVGVERGDRRQRVGQVVEDQDEVGLDEGGGRDADRVTLGEWHGRLERRDRVVRERTDGAAGEARHPVGRLDAAARDEGADGVERVGRGDGLDRQVGRIGRLGHRPGLDPGEAVADLEEPARPDAEERVATEPLPALDRFEQVGRTAVIEAEEGPDRRLEVGRAGGAQEDRVGVGGVPLRLRQADRVCCAHRSAASGESKRPFVSGTKGRAFRGATLFSAMPHSPDRRAFASPRRPIGAALYRWRSAPEPTDVRGSRRFVVRSGGSRGHSLVVVAPARTSRRISGSTRDGYSSRSQPVSS